MLSSFENLELLLSATPKRTIFAYGEKSPLRDLIKGSIPEDLLLPIPGLEGFAPYMNDSKIVEESDVLKRLVEAGADTFFLSSVITKKVEDIARQLGTHVISVEHSLNDKFEDKIFFHNLLSEHQISVPRGTVVKDREEIIKNHTIPFVVQDPASYGSFGTFLIKKEENLVQIPKDPPEGGFLLRQYIDGLAFGLTLLIGKTNAISSQIRLQCSLNEFFDRGGGFFFGIQWVSSKRLSSILKEKIESTVKKLVMVMQKAGFTGIANIDFMIEKDNVYIIECNPRLSGSTWHLANRPDLIHNKDFIDEYINVCRYGEVSENLLTIPETDYEGCTLDADTIELKLPKGQKVLRKNHETAGVFNEEMVKISSNVGDWKKGSYICIPGTYPNSIANSKDGFGVLLSHEPLYIYDEKEVSLNSKGRALWDRMESLFI